MPEKSKGQNLPYKPVFFIISVFAITWCCAVLMEMTDYRTHKILYLFWDFLENASPLLCALFLLRKNMKKDRFLRRFFLGNPCGFCPYFLVFLLFAAQFLNFYCFRLPQSPSLQSFLPAFAGQLLLGGGLEEAGWRGYLLPCLNKKYNLLLSSLIVSLLWVLWHLPYFFMPGTMQEHQNIISYAIIGILTGFILTAIHLLTKSVLLCMLFHSWQNTIVMLIPADTGSIGFLLTFMLLATVCILLCVFKKASDPLRE